MLVVPMIAINLRIYGLGRKLDGATHPVMRVFITIQYYPSYMTPVRDKGGIG